MMQSKTFLKLFFIAESVDHKPEKEERKKERKGSRHLKLKTP